MLPLIQNLGFCFVLFCFYFTFFYFFIIFFTKPSFNLNLKSCYVLWIADLTLKMNTKNCKMIY